MVLHSVTREFIVDAIGDIRNPVGMIGNRLEAHSLIVDAFSPNVKRAVMCVEQAGGKVSGLIFSPLASSQSALSRNQKELGVALVDIGFGKTGLSVYEENKLLHTSVIPAGSGNITNDLAIGLKASVDAAETIKLTFGTATSRDVSLRDMIDLQKISPAAKGTISRRFVSEIISVRLAEIFDSMNHELKKIGKAHKLPGGVVLTGGGAKMAGLVDLARQEMRLPTQIGLPDLTLLEIGSDVGVDAEDPEYACVFGLVSHGYELMKENQGELIGSDGATNFFKKIFRLFNP
jgi:cell division protein FtsA